VPHFSSDGVDLHYIDVGDGAPVLLIHGFASSLTVNWVGTGWVDLLVKAGRRVVAFDNRGHGDSAKSRDPGFYDARDMVEDARRVMDRAGIEAADVIGYSMGARVAACLTDRHPNRVRSAVLGGMGGNLLGGLQTDAGAIVAALEAPSREDVTDQYALRFRIFAENTKSDRLALAACMRGFRPGITAEMLARIAVPVLVAVGSADDIAGSPYQLAPYIPHAEVLEIPGRDHNRAVSARPFKDGVLDFWARRVGAGVAAE
jgi:pimeloyl-ACP methyl ester carboxylesterase